MHSRFKCHSAASFLPMEPCCCSNMHHPELKFKKTPLGLPLHLIQAHEIIYQSPLLTAFPFYSLYKQMEKTVPLTDYSNVSQ